MPIERLLHAASSFLLDLRGLAVLGCRQGRLVGALVPVRLDLVTLRAAAQASVCMEGCCHLPQCVVAPCRADQGDAEGQHRRRVACFGQMLRALRHLACKGDSELSIGDTGYPPKWISVSNSHA